MTGLKLPSETARRIRAVLPFSAWGWCAFFLAAALFVEGLFRADLAGLFWGASFLLLSAYALVAGHLARAFLRRRADDPDFLTVLLPVDGLEPRAEAEAAVSARMPRALPPGFTLRVTLPLSWHERVFDPLRVPLRTGTSAIRPRFMAGKRGVYRGAGPVLELRDVLGLTVHRLPVGHRDDALVVVPSLRPVGGLLPVVEEAESAAPSSRRRRRSEELLEARKYYPGDDMRRINWKVFAHMDELFLRVGEEVPPPESRIVCILDTAETLVVPRRLRDDYLDGLVESCASFVTGLLRGGRDVTFCMPGLPVARSFDAESEPLFRAALADAWWSRPPWDPPLPPRLSYAVVFTTPGSSGITSLLSALRNRGWPHGVLIKGLDPAPTRPRPRVRDLLFVPSDAVRGAAPGTAPGAFAGSGAVGGTRGAAGSGKGAGAAAGAAPRARDLPRGWERAGVSAALKDELAVLRADGERLRYAAEI